MAREGSRRGNLGKSASIPLDEKYMFGSEAERANRIEAGAGYDPAEHAPEFKQIPGAATGKNLNEPNLDHKSGSIKFSNFKG